MHKSVSFESTIDLDVARQPAVLAGILGISTPYVYQCIQEAKLPTDPNTSYRECIQFYLNWYKNKSLVKSTSVMEAKLHQDIRNGVAKEQLTWLSIQERREELVNRQQLLDVMEPVFTLVKSGLVNLSREMPETQEKVDAILRTWATLGHKMIDQADADSNKYVTHMLSKEPEVIEELRELDGEEREDVTKGKEKYDP